MVKRDRIDAITLLVWIRRCLIVFISLSPCLLIALSPLRSAGAELSFDKLIDSPMYRLPALPKPRTEYTLPAGAKELWLRALRRPEADMKCKAAQAIATAHREGFKGFETTIPTLLEVFDQQDQHPTVRLVVAEALIALDAQQAAASFFRQAQSGSGDLRELVEPALARWDHRPAREVWLTRFHEPTTPSRNLTLAIRCLADVQEDKAVEPLRVIALSESVSRPIRLQAARALAALRTAGLEKDAEQLSGDPSRRGLVRRLVAVTLLRQHRGADAVALLQRMAHDPEPTVAAPAVVRLLEIDPQLLDTWVDDLLVGRVTNPVRDANLRLLAVQVLYRRPSPKHLHLLFARLDDEHSGVRVAARDSLRQLAGDNKWRPQILEEAIGLLKTKRWRQLEQATILLVQLDHKPAAGLLVKLLPFDRAEVSITAAWGLRKLAVADTLPEAAKHVETRLKVLVSEEPSRETGNMPLWVSDHQLSQLNQFLGQQKYRLAEPLLRRFVPKPSNVATSVESRAAAIWALGLMHEGEAPADLVTAVEDRLNHTTRRGLGDVPEDPSVRWMAAIALGRWKAKQAVPSLRKHYDEPGTARQACGWALEQITGEAMRPLKTIRKPRLEWFLIPRGGATE